MLLLHDENISSHWFNFFCIFLVQSVYLLLCRNVCMLILTAVATADLQEYGVSFVASSHVL
jgi:hypothetical protein